MLSQCRNLAVVPILTLGLWFPCAANADEAAPPPPYLIEGLSYISVGLEYDPAVLSKLLPADVQPIADVTGGFNIYHAEGGYGFGSYSAAYFYVDIEGFDSADGMKGRWMIQGVYGPQSVSDAIKTYYGWPVRLGGSRHEYTPGGRRAVGFVGDADFVEVAITTDRAKCQPISGIVNYVGMPEGASGMVVNTIPFAAKWCPAELVSLDVSAPDGDPIAQLGELKPLFAGELLEGRAALTQPMPAGG